MKNTITLLGSTGSIGRQTLDVCRQMEIPVAALAAHHSVDLLEKQIREFHPTLAVLYGWKSRCGSFIPHWRYSTI